MQKKKKARDRSTQELMGVTAIRDYGISTPHGDIVFFIVKPTNLSVLPDSGVEGRVQALVNLLKEQDGMEFMAMDSRESFERNKAYYQNRIEAETNPALVRLLEQDSGHLDRIQSQMASSREFCFLVRLRAGNETELPALLNRLEVSIRNNGFLARRAGEQELMRILSVYYEQDISAERYSRFDGERFGAAEKGAKSFQDMIAPAAVKFNTDHYLCGSTYRCAWALREYPVSTEEQAILRHLGEKAGVTLHVYEPTRAVRRKSVWENIESPACRRPSPQGGCGCPRCRCAAGHPPAARHVEAHAVIPHGHDKGRRCFPGGDRDGGRLIAGFRPVSHSVFRSSDRFPRAAAPRKRGSAFGS